MGHLYPKIEITAEMARDRTDLKPLVGRQLTVIAWLWARTVKSPNPAFAQVDVPLATTFMLSTKAGKEAYVEPVIEDHGYQFTVKVGKPKDAEGAKNGTKLARGANFKCLMSGMPISGDYIKAEGKAGRMGAQMMAIVAEGERERVYLAPTPEHETMARQSKPGWKPEGALVEDARAFTPTLYGLTKWSDLFTARQLVALTTFSDLVTEVMESVRHDAVTTGMPDDKTPLRDGGTATNAYAEVVGIYCGFAVSKAADLASTICHWQSNPQHLKIAPTFSRHALSMSWDYAEGNPFSNSSGNFFRQWELLVDAIDRFGSGEKGFSSQIDAQSQSVAIGKLISTDPPYYDNVPYADLSDFFYVWLRHSLRLIFPDLFATLVVPKTDELVAFAYRHDDGKTGADAFFLDGMMRAMHRLAEQAHPAFPVTIYYAFKQSESDRSCNRCKSAGDVLMLTRLRLQNFKSWPSTGAIHLAPITGFFGANSSGKTSLLQSLLLLKQTADSADRGLALHFGDATTLVNLGDFTSVVYRHDIGNRLFIALDWTLTKPFCVMDAAHEDREVAASPDLSFDTTITALNGATGRMPRVGVVEMGYGVGKVRFGMRRSEDGKGEYEIFSENGDFNFVQPRGRPARVPFPVKCYGFPDEVRAYYQNAGFLADLELAFERQLRGIYYLGPLRAYPERQYAWAGAQPADMGRAGEQAFAAILAARERGERISPGPGKRKVTLEQYVAQWLARLDLIHEFRVEPLAEGSRIFQVKVRKTPASADALITDVGFGVSQIIPVLVLCFYVPEGSTVILEQPEIHLHPAVQAGLADVLVDAHRRRGVQVLLESHSEHLLRRLQRRIAAAQLRQDEVALYFC